MPQDPTPDFPITITTVVYPDESPVGFGAAIDPIESVIKEIEDIKVIRTDIEDGMGIIRTEFLWF